MPRGLPVTLVNLTHSLCLVVGGGEIAERKVHALLDADARVRVIAPVVTDELADLARGGKIEWLARAYRSGDLADAFLVIAATDDPPINRAIAQDARAKGLLINIVDDPDYGNFIAPAVVRRGDLAIAISTGGDVPALAGHLRAQLEQQFGTEWGAYVEWLARMRPQIAARHPEMAARRQAWARVLDSDLRAFIAAHGDEEIQARILQILDA
jgi:precorrin-2 dehydrogenase/sirohydrochlorin ferrochelatase